MSKFMKSGTREVASATGKDRRASAAVNRPGLAIVATSLTPYRLHLHRRVATEIPEFRVHSLVTRAATDFDWAMDVPAEINLVTFSGGSRSTSVSAFRHPLGDFRKGGQIIRYIDEHDIEAVIVNGWRDLALLRMIYHCLCRKITLFVRGDSNIKGDDRKPGIRESFKTMLLRTLFDKCDGVMPMGRLGQEFFEKYGAASEKCFRVPYEPDYTVFSEVDSTGLHQFREEQCLSPDRRYLMFSGRLIHVKRLDLLLAAFARVASSRPLWDLLIVGDGPLRGELEAQVPDDLRDRVRWLGFCQTEQMRLAYRAANVLVLTSEREQWALVVNEAVASGLPVVSSDVVGAAYELIEDRVSGRLFKVNDLDALVDAILDVTDETSYDRYRSAVGPALAAWRCRADPIEGIRRALRSVNLLK